MDRNTSPDREKTKLSDEEKRLFRNTALKIVGDIERLLSHHRARAEFVGKWKELESAYHELTGMAEMAGEERISALSSLMLAICRQTAEDCVERLEALNQTVRTLKELVTGLEEDGPEAKSKNPAETIEMLKGLSRIIHNPG